MAKTRRGIYAEYTEVMGMIGRLYSTMTPMREIEKLKEDLEKALENELRDMDKRIPADFNQHYDYKLLCDRCLEQGKFVEATHIIEDGETAEHLCESCHTSHTLSEADAEAYARAADAIARLNEFPSNQYPGLI